MEIEKIDLKKQIYLEIDEEKESVRYKILREMYSYQINQTYSDSGLVPDYILERWGHIADSDKIKKMADSWVDIGFFENDYGETRGGLKFRGYRISSPVLQIMADSLYKKDVNNSDPI